MKPLDWWERVLQLVFMAIMLVSVLIVLVITAYSILHGSGLS